MTLPAKAVDRIFARLSATYGAEWDRSLGNAPLDDVKVAWAHELAGFAPRLTDVAWGLENLPERCPNVIAFRNLCRQAPAAVVARVDAPRADPERVAQAMQQLAPLRVRPDGSAADGRAWARSIEARHAAGERIKPYTLDCARVALGLQAGRGA